MHDINKPMDIPELSLQPPITGKVKLSDDMQQSLTLLCGYFNGSRKLLDCSKSGVLQTVAPRIKDLWGFKSLGDTTHKRGDDIPCNEIMIAGHPDNTGKIWVRPYKQYIPSGAGANFAWPVAASGVVGFVVSNISQLWFYFEKEDDIVITAYTE